MSRLNYTAKNIFYGYISNIVVLLLGFISRTIFISILGLTYLGVNGLFTNVLGVLSLTELGIGTAMTFSLYKPVAENDIEKIKALMQVYKKAYRVIALLVTALGLLVLPFLRFIVKDPGDIGNISIYYIIFLYNTVITYFVSYKYSLLNAEQKNYIFTNINTLTTIITVTVQLIGLFLFRSFLVYLISAALIGSAHKIYINFYLNRKYPYLVDKGIRKLDQDELRPIKKNVGALMLHKLGEISIYQTDNIIISSFINVTTVGILSNYNLVITSVSGFITIIFNSAVSSFGNLIATQNRERQYEVFKVYRFVAFWLYGFSSIAFYILLSPFITVWLGPDKLISEVTVLLIIVNYYLTGHRICINNIKTAGGVFRQDKYIALAQAIVNITVSIIMVKLIGLPGVFVGTVVQGLIGTILRPVIVYRSFFNKHPRYYFIDGLKYLSVVLFAALLCRATKLYINNATLLGFLGLLISVIIIPNSLFFIFFKINPEYKYISSLLKRKFCKGNVK